MDRLIALLAALVGLIALAGAILVQLQGQSEREKMNAALAALDAKITALGASIESRPAEAAAPTGDDGFAAALLALQERTAALEAAAKAQPLIEPAPAATSAITTDGPTTDCIPLGTRFMATVGDATAICKTDVVIKLADVTDGAANIEGAGPITAGGFGKLGFGGCTIMVFSADLASGYAEMRVSCQ